MKKLRWGLLSTAHINRRLIPEIRNSHEGDLVAVASRSQESAEAYASKWNIPQTFGSYEEMLASAEIDVIYNPLPNHLHAEWTIKALRAGKHVLCEKPFALTVEEVDAVRQVAEETGNIVTEAFMYRHHPQTKWVKEQVDAGLLGDLQYIHGAFSFAMADRGATNIRWSPEMGGGAIWDVGVYPISYVQYLMGKFPIALQGSQIIGETGIDTSFFGQMIYEGGVTAQFTCSFDTPFQTSLTLIGSEGRLEIGNPFVGIFENPNSMKLIGRDDTETILQRDPYPLYKGEVDDIHQAILHGQKPLISWAETRQHIETVLALKQSATDSSFFVSDVDN